MKQLQNLPNDIYGLFDPDVDHEASEENLSGFAETMKNVMASRLRAYVPPKTPLRFSSIGKKDRQVWYAANPDPAYPPEPMLPKTYLKFLMGDVWEAVLLFLAKEAGHDVQNEQQEVEVDGVKGHIDAIIDGTVVDVKSASPFGYRKFETGTVPQDDPFGYVDQLAGYANVLTPGEDAAWLAGEKVDGSICISPLSRKVIEHHKPEDRIKELKAVLANPEPPPRCYDDVEDGKSGNRKLVVGCSWCSHKFRCWDNLRGFAYSNGPRYLTKVAKEPNVPEIKIEG